MKLLRNAYREENLDTLMCRSLVSVDWQGDLYDCDFNQMLGLRAHVGDLQRPHLGDLLSQDVEDEVIAIADHCYGCTAGQGSSCGGALEEPRTEAVIQFILQGQHDGWRTQEGAVDGCRPGLAVAMILYQQFDLGRLLTLDKRQEQP